VHHHRTYETFQGSYRKEAMEAFEAMHQGAKKGKSDKVQAMRRVFDLINHDYVSLTITNNKLGLLFQADENFGEFENRLRVVRINDPSSVVFTEP
jgi:hypothetical protein